MKCVITAKNAEHTVRYYAVGNLGALIDAAYDAGALGVTVMVLA